LCGREELYDLFRRHVLAIIRRARRRAVNDVSVSKFGIARENVLPTCHKVFHGRPPSWTA
jgi:hypothetical protein